MHRVNTKDRRTIVLRVIAYSVTFTLSVVTTAILLFIALGYRFNSTDGVIQSGLLLVDSKPEAGRVLINGKVKDTQTPSRFVLPVGDYAVRIERSGYHVWNKAISLAPESVEELAYPLLIPKQLSSVPKLDVAQPESVSQSGNNKLLVYHVAGETTLHVVTLDKDTPTATSFSLSDAFVRESGSVGSLRFIEWSLDNKFVLVEQTLPGGARNVITLPIEKPAEAQNITAQFGQLAPTDPHYVGKDTNRIYGLHEGILRRYNLETSEATALLTRVLSYEPYDNDTIAYTRTSEDGLSVEVVLKTNDTSAVLESTADTALRPVIAYGEYDRHTYVAVSDSASKTSRVYRDALKGPILKKQIPYVTLPFVNANYIKFSPNNQYVYFQRGQEFASYDFENTRQHSFIVAQAIGDRHPVWANNSHLMVQSDSGQNYLLEFDGQNTTTLVRSQAGTRVYVGSDPRGAYRIDTTDSKTTLDFISLVAQ